jgi:hypothetical protein
MKKNLKYLVTNNFLEVITIIKDENGMEKSTTLCLLDEYTFKAGNIKSFNVNNTFERFQLEMEKQRNPELKEVSFQKLSNHLLNNILIKITDRTLNIAPYQLLEQPGRVEQPVIKLIMKHFNK